MIDGAIHLSEGRAGAGIRRWHHERRSAGHLPRRQQADDVGKRPISSYICPSAISAGVMWPVLYAGGMIVDGESATPPSDVPVPIPFVGGERMGDITVNQQLRNLMRDPACGALVVYIDSGGGSASASESMASALTEFAKSRPLVVYMGGVAASGGYYIATPAHWIVAQAGTITGSIGVIMGKTGEQRNAQEAAFQSRPPTCAAIMPT